MKIGTEEMASDTEKLGFYGDEEIAEEEDQGNNSQELDEANLENLVMTPEETDELLASTLNQLSIKEREQATYEIHGVAPATPEDPALVAGAIADFNAEIHKIKSKEAYVMAEFQSPKYVHDPKLVLQFLRSESFNAKKAAKRMVHFFQRKLELFGPERLVEDIKLHHLESKDIKTLETGFMQLLPARDRAGRAIFCVMPPLFQYKSVENLARATYYMLMTAAEDVETQKRGCIFVGYNMGKDRKVDRTAAATILRLRNLVPLKVVSSHYCYDDLKMRPMMTVATLIIGRHGRARFRHHYGSHSDNQYTLLTFGISNHLLPVTSEGEYKVKAHRKWIQQRREEERKGDNITRIVLPSQEDVLFGRGKPIQEHPGNVRYHYILDLYQAKYEEAKKFQKMEVSNLVLQVIAKQNGRFLKQDGAGWVEVDQDQAREKISHAFRTRRGNAGTSGKDTDCSDNDSTAIKRRPDHAIAPSPILPIHVDSSQQPETAPSDLDGIYDSTGVGKRARVEEVVEDV